jgi:HSP20 family protein
MADQSLAPTRDERLSRRYPIRSNPFGMLERFADEVDRMFEDFGLGRGFGRMSSATGMVTWAPQVDVSQNNNELTIRVDLPGMNKEDVKVDVTDDAVTIQGERRREHEEEKGGVFRSERSYGSFYRVIPLPDGAITDQAKAAFKNGVLEIKLPAPPEQVSRGRRLEISEGAEKSK